MNLIELTEDEIELARFTVESSLVELRDSCMFTLRNNGLVIKSRDGEPSSIIRLGMDQALKLAIEAINKSRSVA